MSQKDEENLELLRSKEYLFWKNVSPVPQSSEDCWLWNAGTDRQGYGNIGFGKDHNGRNIFIRSHRYSYLMFVGPIPENLCCLHECDNPKCCNPSHLFLGTRGDNAQDSAQKGRHKGFSGKQHSEESRKRMSESREKYLRGRA